MRLPGLARLGGWLLVGLACLGRDGLTAAAEPDALQAATALESVLVDAIARAEKSVVAIARVRKDAGETNPLVRLPFGLARQGAGPMDSDFIPNDYGAGVVIDPAGLILTTMHVLADPALSDYYVWSNKRPYKATVLATAPWFDLAVLQVDGENWEAITLGDASSARKGQFVVALGNPYAIARDGSVSASWGIISNLTRRAPPTPTRSAEPLGRETLHHYGTLIQTDARLNLGYSGGALVNLQGEMIGLTTSYTAAIHFESAAGLAIPVDDAFRRVVTALKKGETPEFGFLGVGPEALGVSLRRRGFHGARVVSVIDGAPAAEAGLRIDDVITHINGAAIFDESDLFWRIGVIGPGGPAALRILRGDLTDPQVATLELTATVAKKHVQTLRTAITTAKLPSWRGLRVDYATAAPTYSRLAQRPPADSLYVVDVERDSPAWQSGLRPGDFVTHVRDLKVTTPAQFAESIRDDAQDVTLYVTRDGQSTTARTVSP